MKLSAEQIAQIKSWISKRGFTHTDLQYEIIDHVASAIEEKMEEKPELNLEKAFGEVHSSFGVFGFQSFEESIAKKLNTELFHYYWQAAKNIILSEKILLPISLVISLSLVFQQFPQYFNQISQGIIFAFTFISLIYTFIIYRKKKYLKNFLSFKIAAGIIPSLILIIFQLRILILEKLNMEWTLIAYAIITIAIYSVYIGSQKMIRKTEKLHQFYREVD